MMETAVALLDGRLADAERLALDALATVHPESTHALNAVAQIVTAWGLSGRDEDLLNALDGFAAEQPVDAHVRRPLGDLGACSAGERDPRFDRFVADDFESLPWDGFRLGALAKAGAAAAGLRDMRSAAVLEVLLEPYHGQLLILWSCCLVYDAADAVRGDLLTVLGRHAEAVACLEAAAALCERARTVPHSIRTAHRLARALVSRNGHGDHERAHVLAADALARATELGMPNEAKAAQAVLDIV